MSFHKLQKRCWEILEVAKAGDKASKVVDYLMLLLICLNILAVIIGSIQSVQSEFGYYLNLFEGFSVFIFTIEYLLRIWSCVSEQRFQSPILGRIKWMLSPMALIDLLAILPFYIPFFTIDLRFMRIFRLFRIIRILKLARYYQSLQLIKTVILTKKEELILSLVSMLVLLIFASTFIYYCENEAQPEAYPNIPAAMWWAVVTLTTVGYGDVYPITVVGKLFAALIAIAGVGMVALPTGIIGAGFIEEIQKQKTKRIKCPHCGKEF